MIVRSWLHKQGYKFRLHDKKLPGKPDIVLKKYKTVIFVNGCFWHGHKRCKRYVEPKSKKNYWVPKIDRNRRNQEMQKRKLRYLGWNIITIWECHLEKIKQINIFKKYLAKA